MENPIEMKDTDQKGPAPQRREKAPRIQTPRARRAPPPALPMRETLSYPYTSFELKSAPESERDGYDKFGARLGTFTLRRSRTPSSTSPGDASKIDGKIGRDITSIEIQTPAMICSARRGMVKHLSRDNVTLAKGVEWIHVPLEDLYVIHRSIFTFYFNPNGYHFAVSNTQFQYQHTIHHHSHSMVSSLTHHLPTSSHSLFVTLSITKTCQQIQTHSSKYEQFVVYAK
jgi:hypothetical protein